MEGSAVVTTRLSSDAMNPATLVMTSAQTAVERRPGGDAVAAADGAESFFDMASPAG